MGDFERRYFKRVAVDMLCAVVMPNGIKHAVMARNVSLGGLFIECDRPLARGEQAKLILNLQVEGRLQKVEMDVEIVHGPSRVSMSAYGLGLRFVEISPEAQELVERFIDARPALA